MVVGEPVSTILAPEDAARPTADGQTASFISVSC
jgi:hypothetical protein